MNPFKIDIHNQDEEAQKLIFHYFGADGKGDDPESNCIAGTCYEEGLGVEQSYERAIECYKKSAEKTFPCTIFPQILYWMYKSLQKSGTGVSGAGKAW